jgi:hypothetical protein
MKTSQNLVWPRDADRDVLRRMESNGFNFNSETDIDFNIDLNDWPPSQDFLGLLRQQFSIVKVYEPDDHGSGYIQLVVKALVTYELVMFVQSTVSELV